MASSTVKDVFLLPEEEDFDILQKSSNNRKRNASLAEDFGYVSEDNQSSLPKIRVVSEPPLMSIFEAEVFAALSEKISEEGLWDEMGVGYGPCQSPKLPLVEQLIPTYDDDDDHVSEIGHEMSSPLEDPLSGKFLNAKWREMGKKIIKIQ